MDKKPPSYGPGTHYSCGCWKAGDPSDHPYACPTHDMPYNRRYNPPKKKMPGTIPEIKDWDVTKQGEQK